MKSITILVVIFIFFGALCSTGAKDYTTAYDNVDVDSILRSDRLTENYIKCFLDKGPCTPDGQTVKDTLHDALESDCQKCSAKQKQLGDKVIRHLVKNKKPYWDQLVAKYDPEGKYAAKYKDQLKKEGIEI